MTLTLRKLRQKVLELLQSENACKIHGLNDTDVLLGITNADLGFTPPLIVIKAYPKSAVHSESDINIPIAQFDIWCLVEPQADAAETEINAIELCERVDSVLKKEFSFLSSEPPEIVFSFAEYTVANITYTHYYESSI